MATVGVKELNKKATYRMWLFNWYRNSASMAVPCHAATRSTRGLSSDLRALDSAFNHGRRPTQKSGGPMNKI